MNKNEETKNDFFRNIEAYLFLYKDLGFDLSLPNTRRWAASPDFLRIISSHVLENKPENIIECSSGVSTIVLAKSVKKNGVGHVYSLENEKKYAEKTKKELEKHGLLEYATVFFAPLVPWTLNENTWEWYNVSGLEQEIQNLNIDMLVVDGPPGFVQHMSRYPAMPILNKYFNKKTVVFLDDTIRNDESQIVKEWLNAYTWLEAKEIEAEKGCIKLAYKS